MDCQSNPVAHTTISRWRAAIDDQLSTAAGWFTVLAALWLILLALFYIFPHVDIVITHAFFESVDCGPPAGPNSICGDFPYSLNRLLIVIRHVLFFLPMLTAILILYLLIANLQHAGASYRPQKTQGYSIALTSLLLGPCLLVNLIFKEISHRPRPYGTDLFGGPHPFMPAGDFTGGCIGNCSFISGEAAGSGWLACLIILMPKPLRPLLGPPLIVFSLLAPTLRVSFGGHYFSDVTLGWLSSLVVYAGVTACFEMSQIDKNRHSPTNL